MRQPPTVPLTRDLDTDAFGFWGVVSGTWTPEEFARIRAESAGDRILHSKLRVRLGRVLHELAGRGVLDDRTLDPGFDADRRCRSCGTIHAENGFGGCLRGMWGDGAKRAERRSAKGMRRR